MMARKLSLALSLAVVLAVGFNLRAYAETPSEALQGEWMDVNMMATHVLYMKLGGNMNSFNIPSSDYGGTVGYIGIYGNKFEIFEGKLGISVEHREYTFKADAQNINLTTEFGDKSALRYILENKGETVLLKIRNRSGGTTTYRQISSPKTVAAAKAKEEAEAKAKAEAQAKAEAEAKAKALEAERAEAETRKAAKETLTQPQRIDSLLAKKQIVEARGIVDEILKQQPDNIVGLMLLGRIHTSMSNLESAMEVYKRVGYINPNYAPAIYERGNIFLMQQNFDGAKAFFEKTLRLDPRYALAELGLAKLAKVQKNQAGYQRHLQNANKLEPGNKEIQEEMKKSGQ
jgi:tetratricopeptide (TPR) repeat protein